MNFKKLAVILLLVPLLASVLVISCGKKKSPTTSTGSPVATTSTSSQPQATTTTPGVTTVPGTGATVQVGTAVGDACALIAKADAQTALGESVKDPQGVNVGSQPFGTGITAVIASCDFDSTTSAKSVNISLWKLSGGTSAQMRQLMDQIICASKEKVSGVGDSACWYDSDHGELQVIKGTSFVDITISGLSGSNRTSALLTLTQKVLNKLP